jgi:hypothetical protein
VRHGEGELDYIRVVAASTDDFIPAGDIHDHRGAVGGQDRWLARGGEVAGHHRWASASYLLDRDRVLPDSEDHQADGFVDDYKFFGKVRAAGHEQDCPWQRLAAGCKRGQGRGAAVG